MKIKSLLTILAATILLVRAASYAQTEEVAISVPIEVSTGEIVAASNELTITDLNGNPQTTFEFGTGSDPNVLGPLNPINDGGVSVYRYGHRALDSTGNLQNGPAGNSNLAWQAPAGTPWKIEVYTDNELNQPGIVNETPPVVGFLPMKFGSPNTGAVGQDPNPTDENGDFVIDQDEIDAATLRWNTFFTLVLDPDEDGDGPGSDGVALPFLRSNAADGSVIASNSGELDFRMWVEVNNTTAVPDTYVGTVNFDLVLNPED